MPLLPFYGQSFHAAPWQIGLIFSAYSMGSFFGEPFWGRLSDRYAPGLLGGIGLAVLSLGMLSLALLTGTQPPVGAIVWRMALCGIGFGLFQSPNLKAIMTSAPKNRSGGASGMVALARLTGQASGAALVALCFGWGGTRGSTWALGLGAGVAAGASLISSARLWAAQR